MQADLGLVHMKIQEVVQILTNYKSQPQEKSRSAFIDELSELITTYYEYNKELADYFVTLFPPAELINFLEASQAPRPLVIRTNTMRTKRRELAQILIQKGVNLDPAGDWNKVGLKIIDSQVPIGATTEYLAGQYMLQSASSFLPVMALAPKPGERVLDMCAAPGGKTTHIGQIMKNTGVIVANEFNPDRVASVKGNVHRMGLTNVIITNYDGRKIGSHLKGFDRALVDAPCSGLGVIWKDPSVKAMRTLKDIKRNAHIQKELLLSAIDVVNARSSTGGYIVYSTCSVSVEENEEVINYALNNRKVKLVETGLTIGEPGMPKFRGKIFHPSMILCKRIYPHVYNMEGFFIAKLKKIENTIDLTASKPHTGEKRDKKSKNKLAEDQENEGEDGGVKRQRKNKGEKGGDRNESNEGGNSNKGSNEPIKKANVKKDRYRKKHEMSDEKKEFNKATELDTDKLITHVKEVTQELHKKKTKTAERKEKRALKAKSSESLKPESKKDIKKERDNSVELPTKRKRVFEKSPEKKQKTTKE